MSKDDPSVSAEQAEQVRRCEGSTRERLALVLPPGNGGPINALGKVEPRPDPDVYAVCASAPWWAKLDGPHGMMYVDLREVMAVTGASDPSGRAAVGMVGLVMRHGPPLVVRGTMDRMMSAVVQAQRGTDELARRAAKRRGLLEGESL